MENKEKRHENNKGVRTWYQTGDPVVGRREPQPLHHVPLSINLM